MAAPPPPPPGSDDEEDTSGELRRVYVAADAEWEGSAPASAFQNSKAARESPMRREIELLFKRKNLNPGHRLTFAEFACAVSTAAAASGAARAAPDEAPPPPPRPGAAVPLFEAQPGSTSARVRAAREANRHRLRQVREHNEEQWSRWRGLAASADHRAAAAQMRAVFDSLKSLGDAKVRVDDLLQTVGRALSAPKKEAKRRVEALKKFATAEAARDRALGWDAFASALASIALTNEELRRAADAVVASRSSHPAFEMAGASLDECLSTCRDLEYRLDSGHLSSKSELEESLRLALGFARHAASRCETAECEASVLADVVGGMSAAADAAAAARGAAEAEDDGDPAAAAARRKQALKDRMDGKKAAAAADLVSVHVAEAEDAMEDGEEDKMERARSLEEKDLQILELHAQNERVRRAISDLRLNLARAHTEMMTARSRRTGRERNREYFFLVAASIKCQLDARFRAQGRAPPQYAPSTELYASAMAAQVPFQWYHRWVERQLDPERQRMVAPVASGTPL